MSKLAEDVPVQGTVRKEKRRRNMLIICAVSLLNIGLLALIWTQLLTPASNPQSGTFIGHTAPDFSLPMLRASNQQNMLTLSNFKGKAVVLNFWASWCGPCKEEAPLLESAWKQVQGKNVVFLGIDFQESTNNATDFLQSYNITYPAVLDTHGAVANKYGVTSLPVTVFINQKGVVVSKISQELTAQILSSNLSLIRRPSPV
jgi:cytochrome c biogenesis protein CcmG/thiol:disulfide interchange protein DsbE